MWNFKKFLENLKTHALVATQASNNAVSGSASLGKTLEDLNNTAKAHGHLLEF